MPSINRRTYMAWLYISPPFPSFLIKMICPQIKPNGKRCRARSIVHAEDRKCLWHTEDPDIVSKRISANANGGMAYRGLHLKLSKGKIRDSKDVTAFLGEVIENLKSGAKITSSQLSAIAQVSQAYIKSEEKSNTLSRLENLEREFSKTKTNK